MDDWHWITQLNEARAVGHGIEHFRGRHPLNSGSVVWQLNHRAAPRRRTRSGGAQRLAAAMDGHAGRHAGEHRRHRGARARDRRAGEVAARGSATIALAPATVEPSAAEAFTARARRTGDGYEVDVTAHALVKDLCLFPDRLDPAARVDTGLVTLTAGEHHTFVITSGPLDEVAWVRRPVLRCVNDLL